MSFTLNDSRDVARVVQDNEGQDDGGSNRKLNDSNGEADTQFRSASASAQLDDVSSNGFIQPALEPESNLNDQRHDSVATTQSSHTDPLLFTPAESADEVTSTSRSDCQGKEDRHEEDVLLANGRDTSQVDHIHPSTPSHSGGQAEKTVHRLQRMLREQMKIFELRSRAEESNKYARILLEELLERVREMMPDMPHTLVQMMADVDSANKEASDNMEKLLSREWASYEYGDKLYEELTGHELPPTSAAEVTTVLADGALIEHIEAQPTRSISFAPLPVRESLSAAVSLDSSSNASDNHQHIQYPELHGRMIDVHADVEDEERERLFNDQTLDVQNDFQETSDNMLHTEIKSYATNLDNVQRMTSENRISERMRHPVEPFMSDESDLLLQCGTQFVQMTVLKELSDKLTIWLQMPVTLLDSIIREYELSGMTSWFANRNPWSVEAIAGRRSRWTDEQIQFLKSWWVDWHYSGLVAHATKEGSYIRDTGNLGITRHDRTLVWLWSPNHNINPLTAHEKDIFDTAQSMMNNNGSIAKTAPMLSSYTSAPALSSRIISALDNKSQISRAQIIRALLGPLPRSGSHYQQPAPLIPKSSDTEQSVHSTAAVQPVEGDGTRSTPSSIRGRFVPGLKEPSLDDIEEVTSQPRASSTQPRVEYEDLLIQNRATLAEQLHRSNVFHASSSLADMLGEPAVQERRKSSDVSYLTRARNAMDSRDKPKLSPPAPIKEDPSIQFFDQVAPENGHLSRSDDPVEGSSDLFGPPPSPASRELEIDHTDRVDGSRDVAGQYRTLFSDGNHELEHEDIPRKYDRPTTESSPSPTQSSEATKTIQAKPTNRVFYFPTAPEESVDRPVHRSHESINQFHGHQDNVITTAIASPWDLHSSATGTNKSTYDLVSECFSYLDLKHTAEPLPETDFMSIPSQEPLRSLDHTSSTTFDISEQQEKDEDSPERRPLPPFKNHNRYRSASWKTKKSMSF